MTQTFCMNCLKPTVSIDSTKVPDQTKLDEIAVQAMQALITGHVSHYGHESPWPAFDIADYSYEIARAMLEARDMVRNV